MGDVSTVDGTRWVMYQQWTVQDGRRITGGQYKMGDVSVVDNTRWATYQRWTIQDGQRITGG